MKFKARTLKKNNFILGLVEALKSGKLHFWNLIYGASVDVGRIIFIWYASGPGIPPTLGFGRRQSIFLTMRSKIVRRLPSWQRPGVVSQQRLRLRRFDSLVKRSPKLRFGPVSFLFLVCFSIQYSTCSLSILFSSKCFYL